MAISFSLWLPVIGLFPLLIVLGLYVHFKLVTSKYWAKRNIPHLKPVFLLGNMWRANIFENFIDVFGKIHLENRKKKAIGLWALGKPQLMITDVELAKKILIKDFNVFHDRGFEVNSDIDPLLGHLFALKGKTWRNLRVKLTPTFTSGKMKLMFPTLAKSGAQLEKHLKNVADGREVEVKDLTARFTTDVISSCAFGLETNSLENPNSEFRRFGKKVMEPSFRSLVVFTVLMFYPQLVKKLKIQFLPKDASNFFINAVKETIEYREKNQIQRNDFLQLLIQLIRAGKVEDADKNPIEAEGLDDKTLIQKFSLHDAAAQCFVFFAAGFEPVSSSLTLALYELALNPDIQKRLQKEIDEKTEEEISYEKMMSMEYLDMVVQETLRKYAIAGNLMRVSNSDYYIPELDATIDKGTTILFALKGFHHDPDYFSNPEKFDPERFSPENRNSTNGAYIPFGDGPRNCIGNRFALMQFKVGLVYTLKSLNVEVTKSTPIPYKFPAKFAVVHRMPLAFTPRT